MHKVFYNFNNYCVSPTLVGLHCTVCVFICLRPDIIRQVMCCKCLVHLENADDDHLYVGHWLNAVYGANKQLVEHKSPPLKSTTHNALVFTM